MAQATLKKIASGEDKEYEVSAKDYDALKRMAAWAYNGEDILKQQTPGTMLAMAHYLQDTEYGDIAEVLGADVMGEQGLRHPGKDQAEEAAAEEEEAPESKEERTYRPATPSDGELSDSPIADPRTLPFDHPGEDFFLFDPTNPLHYGIINKQTGQYCKYVRYLFNCPDPTVQGCEEKGGVITQTRIIAKRSKDDPNFEDDQKPKDDNLAIFYPWHLGRNDVDQAIEAHKNVGIEADVQRYRRILAEGRRLQHKQIEVQGLLARNQEAKEEVETRLYWAKAPTVIENEKQRLRRVAPYRYKSGWKTVPSIRAGAGPADSDQILYRRNIFVALSPQHHVNYPENGGWYCGICKSMRAYHKQIDCPHNKKCFYCGLPGHLGYECPIPHQKCNLRPCTVPASHCYGEHCTWSPGWTPCTTFKYNDDHWKYPVDASKGPEFGEEDMEISDLEASEILD